MTDRTALPPGETAAICAQPPRPLRVPPEGFPPLEPDDPDPGEPWGLLPCEHCDAFPLITGLVGGQSELRHKCEEVNYGSFNPDPQHLIREWNRKYGKP